MCDVWELINVMLWGVKMLKLLVFFWGKNEGKCFFFFFYVYIELDML